MPAAACRSGAVRLSRTRCPVLRARRDERWLGSRSVGRADDHHDAGSTVAAVRPPGRPFLVWAPALDQWGRRQSRAGWLPLSSPVCRRLAQTQTCTATKNRLPHKETRIAHLHARRRRRTSHCRRPPRSPHPTRRSHPISVTRRSSPIARNASSLHVCAQQQQQQQQSLRPPVARRPPFNTQ
jgi:hypothetical protein